MGILAMFLIGLMGLAGCTTPPLNPEGLGLARTPENLVSYGMDAPPQLWGGLIVRTENLAELTRMEIVSFPLRHQEPLLNQPSTGRFWLEVPKFLDPAVFAPGRQITAWGSVLRVEEGHIGAAPYQFPVLRAQEFHLWPLRPIRPAGPVGPQFGIGIGVRL